MVEKYFGSTLPVERETAPVDDELISLATALRAVYEQNMERYAPQNAVAEIFRVISRANKYIDETTPWVLAKDPAKSPRLATVMYNLLDVIRLSATLLLPVIPDSCAKIAEQIGADTALLTWENAAKFGVLPANVTVKRGETLFPRNDVEKELAELEKIQEAAAPKTDTVPEKPALEHLPEITYDDFMSGEIRVLKVLSCERVPKADKLLKFTLTDGERERTILSGIAEWYAPEDFAGKKLMAVLNLAPRKIRGVVSEGMILSADHDGRAMVIFADESIPEGSRVR
jgi:methionyl-tRNA synthetase